ELPTYFTAENLSEGTYAFLYRLRNLKRPAEVNLANNIQADVFVISENSFRKTDQGDGAGYGFVGGVILGNYYKSNDKFHVQIKLDKINFSCFPVGGETLAGKDVIVYLLKIDDDVADDLSDWNFTDPTENGKTIVGIASYTFTAEDDAATDPNHRFEATEFLNLENPDQEDIILEPGSRYIAAVEYTGTSAELIHNMSERITYYPALGSDQYSTMIYDYSVNRWFTGGLGSGVVAVLGMDVNVVMTPTEELLSDSEVQIYPNPTSDYIRIDMDLQRPQQVNVYLTDVSGKMLKMTDRSNFVNGTIEVDVQSVPAGTYFLNITSPDGMKTEKISVVH